MSARHVNARIRFACIRRISNAASFSYTLSLILAVSSAIINADEDWLERQHPVLVPDVTLEWQSLAHGKIRHYKLAGLSPLQQYEVTISYPASMPTIFSLDLVPANEGRPHKAESQAINNQFGGARRRLLNTEKLIFRSPGDVDAFCAETLVQVKAVAEGVSWDPAYEPQPVLYNIVVSRMLMGVPVNCLPHICVVLLLVAWVVWATFSNPPRWPASIVLRQELLQDHQESKSN